MEINYIILAHTYPKHLCRLINRLNCDSCHFYIHIDKKKDINSFKKELPVSNNIYFIEDRVNVIWGDFSQVEATLAGMKLIKTHQRKGYCILLSGQDYPIKSKNYIKSFYKKNFDTNFISIKRLEKKWKSYKQRFSTYNYHLYPHERAYITLHTIHSPGFYSIKNFASIFLLIFKLKEINFLKKIFKKRVHPIGIEATGGSQWWSLPINTILLILDFVEKNEDFVQFYKYTHIADELFFHSIVSHLIAPDKIQDSVTYVNWTKKNVPLPVTLQDEFDFEEIKNSDCLFARKFYENSSILDKIDSELLHIKI